MVVPCARNVPGRPERIPRGFVAHKAPLQGGGFAPHGSRFCGARCAPLQGGGFAVHGAAVLWRTLCAATGVPKGGCWGKRAARRLQPAETVAANIVRHGRSSGEGRTGPAGTCAPPRFCGERVRIFVAHAVRRYRVAVRGAGRAPRRGLIPRGRCPTAASHPASPLHTILLRPNKHSFFLQNWFLLHNRRYR